ncbi:bacteriohopanetetrol glucosamine biosynthesis glycosyltransferase HpnI [Trinickia caryophylli]|uniref:bacteriohopanetetrol glucosamine biosynthesis glycosyltransferase HpnI n=1 Tax=Trinickia caryophylli TaxID=28094 RepID=UPI000A15CE49|nr:bacteriohopanetetrol glucosamine biosynthesis glycosyltransferase HpnI [Trinickia caryophylli]PMS14316.1 glycosyl transferase [Trinickia caryophylli]TRX20230.1 glycosyltransferase [Trinickia caryophylli]WQE13769.1 bacteriohopanetetrol glucosamine biosynthesis glycosyltransferase HpnI [Trinickia caryophylli]
MTTALVSDWVLVLLCCIAAGYALAAALAMRPASSRRHERCAGPTLSPVSVLKPLCGAEPRLFENLATFCNQTHPHYQLLFGVSSPSDPAIAVVQRLQEAYPRHDIALVVDPLVHGQNLKVSNLINLAAQARHDLIVIADSDIAVQPDYLEAVTAPLADPKVGIVTCLYHARSIGGFWTRVGALFVNEWFAPSVYIAHAGGSRRFGFGATLALRMSTLAAMGGFNALKDCLADDYWLAEHTRQRGLVTVLSDVVVATDVIEPDLASLWLRETRWLRTIRSINPLGFAFLFVTFTAPWLLLSALLAAAPFGHAGGAREAALVAATAIGFAARLAIHVRGSLGARAFWRDLPLVPLRDALLALQWLAAAFGSHVIWRGARMPVVTQAVEGPDGS